MVDDSATDDPPVRHRRPLHGEGGGMGGVGLYLSKIRSTAPKGMPMLLVVAPMTPGSTTGPATPRAPARTGREETSMHEDIEKRFTPQPTDDEQRARLQCLRDAAKAYTEALREHCPPSRERALAETNIEQAAMWASKAVTHNP